MVPVVLRFPETGVRTGQVLKATIGPLKFAALKTTHENLAA
jgi:hypothetical protein